MTQSIENALYLDAITEVTWSELVNASGIPEGELVELVHYGVLVPRNPDAAAWTFEARALTVVKTASRIRRDFELDPHGVSVVLCYAERIERLETELRALKAQRG